MRHWKIAAISVTIAGLTAIALMALDAWADVRFGGFEIFYTSGATDLVKVATLLSLGAVLYLLDRTASLRREIGELREATGRAASTADIPDEDEVLDTPWEIDVAVPGRGVPQGTTGQGKDGLIQLRGVSKTYDLGPVKVHALRDATLDLPPGSLAVILGPSGSGKTTLLNLLGGIDRASSGTILVGRQDITKFDDARLVSYRRDTVGFVFQFFNLIPSLTARENVALAAELVPEASDAEDVLRRVGLADRVDHFPAELSGGEQQRVAIARALVKNPPLLLCDEPTGELDYATGIKVLEVLRAVARDGRAVIVVTHNAVIGDMADLVVHLRGGRIDRTVHNPRPVEPALLKW